MRVDQVIPFLFATSVLGGCGDDASAGNGTTTTTSSTSSGGPTSTGTTGDGESSTPGSSSGSTTSSSAEASSSTTDPGSSSSGGSSSTDDTGGSTGSSTGTTGVAAFCGDGLLNTDDEVCDGDDLDGQTCASVGLLEGELGCSAQCGWDLSACVGCGNGLLEGDEVCDSIAFGGVSCASLGYAEGNPACSDDCSSIDVSDCVPYEGNCCGFNGSLGCSVPECTLTVCQLNSYCCNIEWDDSCATTAYANCETCM